MQQSDKDPRPDKKEDEHAPEKQALNNYAKYTGVAFQMMATHRSYIQ